MFNFQFPGPQVLTRRTNSARTASWLEYWKGKILEFITLRFWEEQILCNLLWILDSVLWYASLILLECIFRHVSCRFWFISSSFSGREPSKCVLQIVPPVLSLNSVTMLKSAPIIVFWLLVMWLVGDWKKFSLWWGLFGPYSVVIWKFCLFNVNVIVTILPALSLTIFCVLPLKFSLKWMTTPAEW